MLATAYRRNIAEADDSPVSGRVGGRQDKVRKATEHEERCFGVLARVKRVEVGRSDRVRDARELADVAAPARGEGSGQAHSDG
jgi:hypothetical protein